MIYYNSGFIVFIYVSFIRISLYGKIRTFIFTGLYGVNWLASSIYKKSSLIAYYGYVVCF